MFKPGDYIEWYDQRHKLRRGFVAYVCPANQDLPDTYFGEQCTAAHRKTTFARYVVEDGFIENEYTSHTMVRYRICNVADKTARLADDPFDLTTSAIATLQKSQSRLTTIPTSRT